MRSQDYFGPGGPGFFQLLVGGLPGDVRPTEDAVRGPTGRIPSRQQARAAREAQRRRFGQAHRAQQRFERQLRKVAKQVGAIVLGMAPDGDVSQVSVLTSMLDKYAQMLQPWAQAMSRSMVEEVARRDAAAWAATGKQLGRALRVEIASAPTGAAMKARIAEATELITSLPREAAARVQRLTVENLSSGIRADELKAEILRTGAVTESRAMLIARTETTRTATALVEARARKIGSKGYIWRTAGDADVRDLHKDLEGTFHDWNDPPVAGDRGERAHPGAIYNCRCWPEVVIPDDL